MAKKIKFHIGDIVSVISGTLVSLPERPPIGADGKSGEVRDNAFAGLLQLIEFASGTSVPRHENPKTGARQFDMREALELGDVAADALRVQFPQVALEIPPEFSNDRDVARRQVRDYVTALEQRYGEYLEVEAPQHQHRGALDENDQRRRGNDRGPFSKN